MERDIPKSPVLPAIGFIGGGNMAQSLIGGMIANGFSSKLISVSDPLKETTDYLERNFSVATTEDNRVVVSRSAIVVLAVKPQVMRGALTSIQETLQEKKPLLISIAAAIRINEIDSWSGGGLSIVRVMPNTPALIQKGMSGMYANPLVSDEQRSQTATILNAVGKTVWVDSERAIDAVTAVSGSGPAYFFFLIEAIEQAALELGLSQNEAHLLATQTAVGASHLAAGSDEPASVLRERVTSPGGTTQKALEVLNSKKVKDAIVEAVKAAEHRAVELSEALKDSG